MVRGGWENPARLSLLRNQGDGVFEDVTLAAGLGEPIASHSAAWGDFDNDGQLDLFVCGEYAAASSEGISSEQVLLVGDPRNRCRLYRNEGRRSLRQRGTVKRACDNDRYAKAAVGGDLRRRRPVDLYVSELRPG